MILDTASRQLWSSLRTWERKPQMVVTGPNTLSRYLKSCTLRASRMLVSLKESAKGSPWSRAKRARTSFKVVIGESQKSRVEVERTREASRRTPVRTRVAQTRIASHLHYRW